MRIGVDIDGVVYDWEGQARKMLEQKGVILKPSTGWNSIKEGVDPKWWEWLWSAENAYELFTEGAWIKDAIVCLDALMTAHDVYFVTATPKNARGHRHQRLLRTFYNSSGLIFVPPGDNKEELTEAFLDAIVDDKPEVVLKAKCSKRVLFAQEWNKEFAQTPGIVRCVGWPAVLKELM